jgi:hypothetical protein
MGRVAPRPEGTIAELLAAIPALEQQARDLQPNPTNPGNPMPSTRVASGISIGTHVI